jgi:hypothetical protein
MKIGLFGQVMALTIGVVCAAPAVSVASPALDAAKACRTAITAKGKAYANTRRRLLLACADRLLKCNLQLEVEGHTSSTCLSLATSSCIAKLGSASTSSLNTARTKFHDKVGAACTAMGVAAMCSTGSGGLWFGNDPTCGTSNTATCGSGPGPDLSSLINCLRDEIDPKVDQDVGRVKPRAGLLLDNINLGNLYPNIPRPPTTNIVVSLSPANSSSGTLVLTPDPSTNPIPNGNTITFTGDATSLPCGGGMGNNGTVTISISTAVDPCADPEAQRQTIKQPYGPSEVAVLGPFDEDENICVKLHDPGGMGGGCNVTETSTVDYNPGGATEAATSSANLLACETRFANKVKALARFTANKMHGCADKVAKCKLAAEIDAVDPTSCLSSAHTACMGVPQAITDKLALFKDPFKTSAIPHKCGGLITFSDLLPYVKSLGFSTVAAECGATPDLNCLMDRVLGVPGSSGTFGTKCLVERKTFIRDPRANDSFSDTAIMLDPTNNFPCLN